MGMEASDRLVTSVACTVDSQMGEAWQKTGSLCMEDQLQLLRTSHLLFLLSFFIHSLNSFIHLQMGGYNHSAISDHSLWTPRASWKHGKKSQL